MIQIKIISIVALVILQGCTPDGNGSSNNGVLSLQFERQHEFNPNATPGIIDDFKITVAGEGLDAPIVRHFTADSEAAQVDGLPDGAVIEMTVEAINQNGDVIHRGYSDPVTIQSGEVAQTLVKIFNVPIFTNVRPLGYINIDRFVPKVFAPGEIPFQLINTVGAVTTSLSDVFSGEITLSISSDLYSDSIRPVYVSGLGVGDQVLSVEDPETHEATAVQITGYHSPSRKVLTTTAGGLLGSVGRPGIHGTNLGSYMQTIAEF